MQYTIKCSFGEIVDKITILQIKISKCKNVKQSQNILNEYNSLCIHINDKQNDTTFKCLYEDLYKINEQLWGLEDLIREKSKKKEFDNTYIETAENIHKKNDERYFIKKQINTIYNSDIIEEKIYNDYDGSIEHFNLYDDNVILNTCSNCFETGEFIKSKMFLKKLCDKYIVLPISEFSIKVYFSYNTVMQVLNETNMYEYKLHEIINIININKGQVDYNFFKELNQMYALHLLKQNKYIEVHKYIKYLQPVTSPQLNISPETMGFFKEEDINKTLLYFAGGIGDIIMYTRFIKHICELQQKKNNNNKVVFLTSDNLYWIYNYIYKNVYTHINNITIIPFMFYNKIPEFDYHVNICMLFSYLKLDYSDIFVDYYLENISIPNQINFDFIDKTKPNIIINWFGNKDCLHEKYNRGIPLHDLEVLFQKTKQYINWICIQKNISKEDSFLLKSQNVKLIGEQLDNDGDSFKDTISVMRQVDLVISSDTSIVHVAGTANIPCWCLLTKGCDWRWTNKEYTNWYPNIKLYRQKNILDWSNVVEEITQNLQKKYGFEIV